MQGQEFLIEAIQEIIPPTPTPDSIKHLSRTDLIEIANFPAVIILEEPFDYSQAIGQNNVITQRQNCNLNIIIDSSNVNELTESNYMETKQRLNDITDEVIAAILEKAPNIAKIANVRFGKGEVYDGVISAIPVMWNVIPVELILVN